MKPKVCYVVNFYLGERRSEVKPHIEDRLLFLKHQILTLSQYKHNLTKIIFNFNLREEDKLFFQNNEGTTVAVSARKLGDMDPLKDPHLKIK